MRLKKGLGGRRGKKKKGGSDQMRRLQFKRKSVDTGEK